MIPKAVLRLMASLCWFCCAFASAPAEAETIRLRSGDHEGFTRLVVDLGQPTDWTIGRSEAGYELRIARDGIDFDLSDVYRLISRDRVKAVEQGGTPGALTFSVTCDCHATAFVTGSGALVVDIADGVAPANSVFEQRLDVASDTSEPSTSVPIPPASSAPAELAQQRTPKTTFAPRAPADPRLALFWRGVDIPSMSVGQARTETNVAQPIPKTDEKGAPDEKIEPNFPARGGSEQTADADMLFPQVPDARVIEAQTELLHQLSRAAAQGLVKMDRPTAIRPEPQPSHPDAVETVSPAVEAAANADQIAVHAETSIDRDTLATITREPLTAEGHSCLPDSSFDLAHWGDDRPATIQIAEKRAPLVGEFDRPSRDAVLALARLYLYLGFGAEARAVLAAFVVESDDVAILAEMATILDGGHPGPSATISGMTGCDTVAALWAVLAWADLPPDAEIDEGAALRAFSALPIHLRRTLGPELSDKFLSVGSEAAAHAVRDAIARAPGDAGASLTMVEAKIDLAAGRAQDGERVLDPLARSNDPLSVDALVLAIQSRLARGHAVETDLADSAEALAFELQDGPQGPLLNQLNVLARGSGRDFDRAFDAYRHWAGIAPETTRADTARRLFGMIANDDQDEVFLAQYFRNRDILDMASPDLLLALDLASRLAKSGFTSEVRRLLKGEPGYTERGRRLLARAALSEFDPATALEQLSGLDDHEAQSLRADALAMAGDHAAAAASYSGIGETDRAGREAWRGGDWRTAAENAPEPIQSALETFGLVPPAGTATNAETDPRPIKDDAHGPLAEGRTLIEASKSVRTALDALMTSTADGL